MDNYSAYERLSAAVAVFDRQLNIIYKNGSAGIIPTSAGRLVLEGADFDEIVKQLAFVPAVTLPSTSVTGGTVCRTITKDGDNYCLIVSAIGIRVSAVPLLLGGIDFFDSYTRHIAQKSFISADKVDLSLNDDGYASDDLDEAMRGYFGFMRASRNIKYSSLIELMNRENSESVCDLVILCSDLVAAADIVTARGIKISFESSAESACCKINKSAFETVLLNLIDNSIKYTRDGNSIHIKLDVSGERVGVSVVDFGVGMKPENLVSAKAPYFSENPLDEHDARPGLGLGLTVAETVASYYGGTLLIESVLGKGTSVTLTLPICRGESPDIKATRSGYVTDRFSPLYIMLNDSVEQFAK